MEDPALREGDVMVPHESTTCQLGTHGQTSHAVYECPTSELVTLQSKLQEMEQAISTRLSTIEHRLSKVENDIARQVGQLHCNVEQTHASEEKPATAVSMPESLASNQLTHCAIHVDLEHNWCDSVWDVSFFIGSSVMSTGSSISVAACLLLNLFLLLAFISECKHSLITSVTKFHEESRQDFHVWRTQIAHDVRFRSFSGESLVSGVCQERLYLPLGNFQLSMVKLLRTYLQTEEIFNLEFPAGVWLCSLAICVWLLTLTVEVRSIVDVIGGFWSIPVEPQTIFLPDLNDQSKMHLISTSLWRRCFVMLIAVLRLVVVTFLGWYGTLFLAHEVDIANMVLNCVALEIILDFDELLFAALVPKIPQATLSHVMPLRYRRKQKNWNTWGVFILLALALSAVFIAIHVFELQPYVQLLKDNHYALCGGHQGTYDFVVAVDALGIPWAATTSGSGSIASQTYAQSSIAKVQDEEFAPPVSPMQPTERNNTGLFMQVFSVQTLERMATLPEFQYPRDWAPVSQTVALEAVGWSEEVQVLRDKDFGDQLGTVYNYYLKHLLRVSGDVSCAQVPFERCNTQGSTQQAVVMRQLCPNWCGCASPTTGTVGSPKGRNVQFGFAGCAEFNLHKQHFSHTLGVLTCEDTTSYDSFASWAMGLGTTPHKTGGMLTDQVLSVFKIGGCPQVVAFDIGAGDYSRICEETSLPALCPESCGCNAKVEWTPWHTVIHDFCPYSCNRSQPPCFTIEVNHSVATGTRGPRVGWACVFPFSYKGVTYHTCTPKDWVNPWCAVMVDWQGASYIWGDCPDSCLREEWTMAGFAA